MQRKKKPNSLLNDGMLDTKMLHKREPAMVVGEWMTSWKSSDEKMIYLYHQYCCSRHQKQPS